MNTAELYEEILADVSFEYCDLIDIFGECLTLMTEYESLVIAMPVVTTEGSNRALTFEDAIETFWDKMKRKLIEFFKAVGKLFEKLWDQIKDMLIDVEVKRFKDKSFQIRAAMSEYANSDHTITVRNWELEKPFNEFIIDISVINTIIKDIYNASDNILERIMTFKENDVDDESYINQLNIVLKESWEYVCDKCNLPIVLRDKDSITNKEIKTAINSKYYAQAYIDGEAKTKSIKLAEFVDNFRVLESLYSSEGSKEIKSICDNIRTKSSKCEMVLKDVDRYTSSSSSNKSDEHFKKIINIRNEVSKVLTSTTKVAMALGTEYWTIYMNIRKDAAMAARAYLTLYNRSNKSK